MLSADDTPTPLSPAAESDQHKLLRGATSSTTTTPFQAPPQFRRADSSILAQRKREQLAAQPVGVAFAPSSWISSLSILRETIVDRVLYRPWLVLTLATAVFCGISTAAVVVAVWLDGRRPPRLRLASSPRAVLPATPKALPPWNARRRRGRAG